MTVDSFPYSNIGFQIGRAARDTRALLDAYLAGAGTTFATWTVLATIEARGPMIQRDLAGELDVEGPTLVRRLDRLEEEGLVLRRPVATDRRLARVELTSAGRARYRQLRQAVQDCERDLEAGVDPADLDVTRRTLRVLSERAGTLRRRS